MSEEKVEVPKEFLMETLDVMHNHEFREGACICCSQLEHRIAEGTDCEYYLQTVKLRNYILGLI